MTLIYPHDDIFAAVKQEASLYAVRQRDKDGNPVFETLVFDEAYLTKFRELFFNAQAQIIPVLSAYLAAPCGAGYFERRDFSKNRDFICNLDMPCDFNQQMARPLEDHIFNFLKDWIMYKWLETKMPETAAIFLANCIGPDGYKGKIIIALNARNRPTLRRHSLF